MMMTLSHEESMVSEALIVVDVQNYFVNEHTRHLPDKVAHFISDHHFDFVLFTKFRNYPDSNFFKRLGWKECLDSPDTDIHPSLTKFVHQENVFEKTNYSIFKSRQLVHFLRKNQIKKIHLCGMDTDACVLASAFEGFDLGYEIRVLKDLSFSHGGEKLHVAAWDIIQKNLK